MSGPQRRHPSRDPLRRLVLAGNLMAAHLTLIAAGHGRAPELRHLVSLWDQMLAQLRESMADKQRPRRERIGPCEICGTTDHHLVEGVCPACRAKYATVPAEEPVLGAEADVSHVRLGSRP